MSNIVLKSLGGGEVGSQVELVEEECSVAKTNKPMLQPSVVTFTMSSSGALSDAEEGKQEQNNSHSEESHGPPQSQRWNFFQTIQRWCFLVLVGGLAVSFWRGLWTLFDIYSCAQDANATLLNGQLFCISYDLHSPKRRDSGLISWGIGLLLTGCGKSMFAMGLFDENNNTSSCLLLAARRILMVQIMGMGGVLTWRGNWILTETWIYPDDLLKSCWLTATLGCLGCVLLCCSASLAAAPTGLLEDPALESFATIGSIILQRHSFQMPRQHQSPNIGRIM